MESLESSIEPRTLCSAALSCGGVRSPGRLGRSPGAYAAGPSPQSSPTLSRGGSGRPGTSHDPCSVMLTRRSFVLPPRGPVLPTDVTGVTLGMTTDSDDGPASRRDPTAAPAPPGRESRRSGGRAGSSLSTGAGDNRGRAVDDTPPAVAGPVDKMWTEAADSGLSRL